MDIVRPKTCGNCTHWYRMPQNPQAIVPPEQLGGQCREELKVVSLITPQGMQLMNLFAQVPFDHTRCDRFVYRGDAPPESA